MKAPRTHFHTKRPGMSGGYSLIETVMYIALFVLLASVLVGTLFGMTSAYREIRVNDDLLDSSSVAMERMTREIRDAVSIDTGASTFGATPGTLTLNSLDGSGAPKTVEFNVAGSGALDILDSTDGTARDLTGGHVVVTSLVFRNVTTAIGSAVKVEATFQSVRAPGQTVTESGTAMLRGSY